MSGDHGHLAQMANDIGAFFRAQTSHEAAVEGIANHIASFWTPRMRAKLLAQMAEGDLGLDDLPREAMQRLAQRAVVKPHQAAGGDAG